MAIGCRAKIKSGEFCNTGVSPSKPNDGLCGVHWHRKYGHIWQTQDNNYFQPRICRNCGRAERVRYSESFTLCEKPFRPDLPMYSEDELKAVIRDWHAPLIREPSCEEKLVHWMARAKIAERQLEERFYED
jgi:hypothetical protein